MHVIIFHWMQNINRCATCWRCSQIRLLFHWIFPVVFGRSNPTQLNCSSASITVIWIWKSFVSSNYCLEQFPRRIKVVCKSLGAPIRPSLPYWNAICTVAVEGLSKCLFSCDSKMIYYSKVLIFLCKWKYNDRMWTAPEFPFTIQRLLSLSLSNSSRVWVQLEHSTNYTLHAAG